jgi:hypothetical protein
MNASTQRSVTSVTTPSAPTLTRAARNTSGADDEEHLITSPVPVTISSASTKVDRHPNDAPVPWVPVASAPATVCPSMSPRLGRASPCVASTAFNADSRIPAGTATCRVAASTDTGEDSESSSTRTPEVAAADVKE